MTDHYDQREALYESGNWPAYAGELAKIQSKSVPGGPQWQGGEPVNLQAAAMDADAWLLLFEAAMRFGNLNFLEFDSASKLAACRAALRKMLEMR